MVELACASCGRTFAVRPQSPNQTYCSEQACQSERRRRWNRGKLQSDPDYRGNQLSAQRAWHGRNPTYWKDYRRRRQAMTLTGAVCNLRATSDASICGADPEAGICWMEIRTPGPDGETRIWRVEVTLMGPQPVANMDACK